MGTTTYGYDGLGNRLQMSYTLTGQTAVTTTFSMDIASGLSQVLDDGTNAYLYGYGRIAQVNTGSLNTDYFLTDALGSVRQMTDASGAVTLAQNFDPYGVAVQSSVSTGSTTGGAGSSRYGFDGEQTDSNGLVYLRSRYYSADTGRSRWRACQRSRSFGGRLWSTCWNNSAGNASKRLLNAGCDTLAGRIHSAPSRLSVLVNSQTDGI